jgi:enoyl-CoA hydratase/carnithine racemase
MSKTPATLNIPLSELDEGTLRLTLNNAARRNALSEDMLSELGYAFASASKDSAVWVVI